MGEERIGIAAHVGNDTKRKMGRAFVSETLGALNRYGAVLTTPTIVDKVSRLT